MKTLYESILDDEDVSYNRENKQNEKNNTKFLNMVK